MQREDSVETSVSEDDALPNWGEPGARTQKLARRHRDTLGHMGGCSVILTVPLCGTASS